VSGIIKRDSKRSRKRLPARGAYFECLHELKLIVDLITTAAASAIAYPSATLPSKATILLGRALSLNRPRGNAQILAEIATAAFAKPGSKKTKKGLSQLLATRHRGPRLPIEQLGPKLRAMMPFLQPVTAPVWKPKRPNEKVEPDSVVALAPRSPVLQVDTRRKWAILRDMNSKKITAQATTAHLASALIS